MEKEKIIKVYEAIKSDNEKLFTSLMLSKSDLNLCFGRFPILSLCYLFKSEKILSIYERFLMPINKFEIVPEYFEIYKAFKKHAKKSLRLFADSNEIVYPILMLGVLDERNLIALKYKYLFKNEEILNKLRKIYILNQKIEINANSTKFECEAKKIKISHKFVAGFVAMVFMVLSVFSFASMSILNGTFGKGTKNSPIYISTEEEFLMALQKGNKYYVLKNDLTLSKDVSFESFSGTIDGDGKFLKIKDSASEPLIKTLEGTIQNLSIEILINDKVYSKNYAILTENNKGTVTNCDFYADVNCKINASTDTYISGIAVENNGTISNCSIKMNSNISNEGSTNAYLSAVAGKNAGTISNCETIDSRFISDTVDLSGIVAENNGTIESTTNGIDLSQTSSKDWHPNCAGIAMLNNGSIENCKNIADIFAESTVENKPTDGDLYVIAGGISCDNYGGIKESKNEGAISAIGKVSSVIVGGIVATNSVNETAGVVDKCKSTIGKLSAKSSKSLVYVGGVVAQNVSKISNSGFEGTISAHSESDVTSSINVYAGGVVGFNNTSYSYSIITGCYSDVGFEEPTENEKVGDNQERVNNVYGAIAGCVGFARYDIFGYTNYMFYGKNNHFVEKETQNSIGYWMIYDFSGSLIGVQKVAADTTVFISHETIDDIPGEVRI